MSRRTSPSVPPTSFPKAQKGFGFLQIDLVNTFSSLRQVQKLAPSVYPWVKWSLESQGLLFCKGETLLSESGVTQLPTLGVNHSKTIRTF